ncbi:MAG: LacI family transcriptional regulator [Chitinophagaceae bacterium]|nr:LacI family transcriptional regulator [Chitinophagaceae bacterium]
MKKGITLKDLAKKLNMSVSTVSKSLNNDQAISPLTKERVKELAAKWNYVANESARHFKLNKSFTIGFILPDLRDPFFVEAINGIEEVAGAEKYNIILAQSHENTCKEESIVNMMIRNRVDGLIAAVTKNTIDMTLFEKFRTVGIPVIYIVREPRNDGFNYVSINNVEGAFKATDFLIKKGHRRIAHIMGPRTMPIAMARFEGYRQALLKSKIPFDEKLVKSVDFTEKETEKAMVELMKLDPFPTAVFTFKNDITLDAIVFLKKKYKARLDCIDFTDFGNLPVFKYLEYKPVASVKEDFFEMGRQAALLLFEIINDNRQDTEKTFRGVKIPCKVIINR